MGKTIILTTANIEENSNNTKLVYEEKQHFNKAVKASGLMETVKLKPIDEDKKDLVERFKVLRGQFIAGNKIGKMNFNAPTLIKELRSVIFHFMEKDKSKNKMVMICSKN